MTEADIAALAAAKVLEYVNMAPPGLSEDDAEALAPYVEALAMADAEAEAAKIEFFLSLAQDLLDMLVVEEKRHDETCNV